MILLTTQASITISEVSKRINSLSDHENMASLSYSAICDWLLSLGMLAEKLDGNGKKVKYPTPPRERASVLRWMHVWV